MSRDALSVQHVAQARSSSMSNPYTAPQLLPVCCICGSNRDEAGSRPQHGRWVTPKVHQNLHRGNPSDFSLMHTYSPTCLVKGQKSVRLHLREIGTSK